MKNKEKEFEHRWVPVSKSHVFGISELRDILKPNEQVYYLPETIKNVNVMGKIITFISVIKEDASSVEVPLYILDFSQEQKTELVEICRVRKKSFETLHFCTTDLLPSEPELLELED